MQSNDVRQDMQKKHLQRPSVQPAGENRLLRKPVNITIRYNSDDNVSVLGLFSFYFYPQSQTANEIRMYKIWHHCYWVIFILPDMGHTCMVI